MFRCLIKGIFHGAADKIPREVSKIIVVPVGKLGDVVCCTPVLKAIRTHLPNAKIIVAGNSKLHRPLLADSGLADEYLDLGERDVEARIKACRADVGLITDASFEPAALFYLSGIPLVVGPRGADGFTYSEITRPYKIIQKLIKTYPYKRGEYAPRTRIRTLEPLGIVAGDATKHLGYSESGLSKVREFISGLTSSYKYLIGISAAAGNKEKQWPPENFAKVANHLIRNHNACIIIIGGKNDITESTRMLSFIEDKTKVKDTTGTISLDELKALIAQLDLFISVNTGPIYIAEAFNVSTVDLVGPVNAWDQPPQGKIHKKVFAPGNPEPLLSIMNSRDHDVEEARRIAQSTRVEDVITAAEEALKELQN